MNVDVKAVNLILNISPGGDVDADDLDHLTRQLLAEIQEIEVESVALVRDEAKPTGTKAVESVTLGALAVALLPVVIPKLIEFLQSWVMRGENRTVKIKTQIGDRSVEVEYSLKSMSPELQSWVDALTEKLT